MASHKYDAKKRKKFMCGGVIIMGRKKCFGRERKIAIWEMELKSN